MNVTTWVAFAIQLEDMHQCKILLFIDAGANRLLLNNMKKSLATSYMKSNSKLGQSYALQYEFLKLQNAARILLTSFR